MHQSSAASPTPQLPTEPRSVFSAVGALLALAAAAGPLAVLAVLVIVPTVGALRAPAGSGFIAIPAALADQEHEAKGAGPMERSAVLTVGAGANVAVRYSSSWEHAVARCIVETTGVPVYIVNAGDADTTAGTGPYCDTCRGGATIPPIGHGYLRTSAGVATVRCSFNDGWSAGLSFPPSSGGGAGGLTTAAVDAAYLRLDATNDPVTGQVAIDSGAAGTQLLVRGNGAEAACSPGAAFNPSIKFSGSTHGMGIAQGLASGVDELALCNDGTRMSIGSNSAEFSFANGIKPDGDDVRPFGTWTDGSPGSGRRWILNASRLLALTSGTAAAPSIVGADGNANSGLYFAATDQPAISSNGSQATRWSGGQTLVPDGTNLAPSFAWSNSTMTGFAMPTTHSISAFSQGVTIWEGGGGVFNLTARPRLNAYADATNPDLGWMTDQDSGIYRAAADTVAIATGGANRIQAANAAVTATVPVLVPSGSASAPSFAASGDTNTGAYFPGADTYGIATAGTARVAWDPYSMISYVDIVPSSDEGADLGLNGYQWDQVRARQILSGNPGGTALSIGDSVEMREQTGTSAADYLKLPVHLNDDVTTKPTCSTSADAGKLVYFDDTGDATVAGVCICGANAANSYGWRSISNFGVNCHL